MLSHFRGTIESVFTHFTNAMHFEIRRVIIQNKITSLVLGIKHNIIKYITNIWPTICSEITFDDQWILKTFFLQLCLNFQRC